MMRLCWSGSEHMQSLARIEREEKRALPAAHLCACCRRTVDESHIKVNGKSIRIVSSRDPLQLPWKEEVRQPGLFSLHLFTVPALALPGIVSYLCSADCSATQAKRRC